jgi:hypothetical protein
MLLCVSHVRPDTSDFVSFIFSVTAEAYIARDHVKLVNEKLLTLQATSSLGLEFPKLDYATGSLYGRYLCEPRGQVVADRFCGVPFGQVRVDVYPLALAKHGGFVGMLWRRRLWPSLLDLMLH